MNKPYLIQRGKFQRLQGTKRIPTTRTGIDDIIRWDYMGAAEFEFGALPKSLNHIKANADKYSLNMYRFPKGILHNDLLVSVLCTSEQFKQISEEFLDMLVGKTVRHFKEYCDLKDWYEGEQKDYTNDLWWDIEGHWMVWISSPDRNEQMTALLETWKTEQVSQS